MNTRCGEHSALKLSMPRQTRGRVAASVIDLSTPDKPPVTSCVEPSPARLFTSQSSISKYLFCSICQEVFKDPVRVHPCGHSFCSLCIHQWLGTSNTCPEDRSKVREKDLHPDRIVQNIIDELEVVCEFRKMGCQWQGPVANLKSHHKHCDFNIGNLPLWLRDGLDDTAASKSNPPASMLIDSDSDIDAEEVAPLRLRLFQKDESRGLLQQFMKPVD